MLAILTTHPIQYQVPIWQALAKDGRVPFEVWYLTDFGTKPSLDREFGKAFSWDIDTLSGYPHRFMETEEGANPDASGNAACASNCECGFVKPALRRFGSKAGRSRPIGKQCGKLRRQASRFGCVGRATIWLPDAGVETPREAVGARLPVRPR